MFPYEDIIETGDRSWSFRLFQRLRQPDVSEAEREQLVTALCVVSDPRIWDDLQAQLTNRANPEGLRCAASRIIAGSDWSPDVPITTLRDWWRQGDAVLRRHALRDVEMGRQEPDVVCQVAADPAHEFHIDAIERMDFSFARPEHQRLKVAALHHANPRVREAAAYVLLWDEPVVAEGPLLGATGDPVPAVAAEACNTLAYYPSQRVLRRMDELSNHPSEMVRDKATESYGAIRGAIQWLLCGRNRAVAAHVRNWLQSVWDLLDFTGEELQPEEDSSSRDRRKEEKEVLSCREFRALLDDADQPARTRRELLGKLDWQRFSARDRQELRGVLLAHPDQLVRHHAAAGLLAWADATGLVALAQDRDFIVRKSAMYNLSLLPPDRVIAQFAWAHLVERLPRGVHATETLNTFVRHADPGVVVPRLVSLADDPGQSENVRTAAVKHLVWLEAAHTLDYLSTWLAEAPAVTWALHIALLDGIVKLDRPRCAVDEWHTIDNLDLQAALARYAAGANG